MSDVDHLLFALKHDGISLAILAELFDTVKRTAFEASLVRAVKSTPTGIYHRRLWYLYEWYTGRRLSLRDASGANYTPLLEPDLYFVAKGQRSPRHRVLDNLPGNRDFCPIARRLPEMGLQDPAQLKARIEAVVADVDPQVLTHALAYIYTKETKSSFAIEHERPTTSRAERFVNLLAHPNAIDRLDENALTEIQNRIVDPRFAEDGFRSEQNYVGESLGLHREIVHYVPPKPADVDSLMDGWMRAVRDLSGGVADPVAWAAAMSFGFVFIHPFLDGNGRLHRFLIHYVLALEKVTPEGVIAPVSAVMLERREEYDRCLEEFSRPLLELVDYDLAESGRLTVSNDTARYYRYFDATAVTYALYRWLHRAVEHELRDEIGFLAGLRAARTEMREIVDLPDRLADLFVTLVASNHGHLAKRKRDQFAMLSDDEVAALEAIVRRHIPDGAATLSS